MKNFYAFLITFLFIGMANAQSYQFNLVHNGGYSFTVTATPDFDATNTDISDIGFAVMLPAGNTDIINLSQFNARDWTASELTAATLTTLMLGDGTRDGFAITLPPGQTILSHSNGVPFDLVSFEVSNTPTSGTLEILENTDPIATGLSGAFDSFYNSNIDNTSTNDYFGGLINGSFMFNTLSTTIEEQLPIDIRIVPNPVKDKAQIAYNGLIERVLIYDLSGKLIQTFNTKEINLAHLKSGVYFAQITNNKNSVTKKIIKN